MSKRFNNFFCVFVVIYISFVFSVNLLTAQPERPGEDIRQTAMQLQRLIKEKQAQGVDVSEALKFDRKSQEAMEQGKPEECLRLLREAIVLLEEKDKQKYERSPFGISYAISRPYLTDEDTKDKTPHQVRLLLSRLEGPYKHVKDLDSKWVRQGVNIAWSDVQPTPEHVKNNIYDWEITDGIYGRVPQGTNSIEVIAADYGVDPVTWEFLDKGLEEKYMKFVKEVIERYDGDGYRDMPGLTNPIKYWIVENEPAHALTPDGLLLRKWQGYAYLLRVAYQAIKSADPQARVSIAGLAGGENINNPNDYSFPEQLEFYTSILEEFQGKYIDIFDIHFYGPSPSRDPKVWRGMKDIYRVIRRELDKNGYQDTEIWITETATVSKPGEERLQAIDLIKRYIYPVSFGIKKVFWFSIIEGYPPLENGDDSDFLGLVYDGLLENDPGYDTKKLSYYTYKRMVETLEGSDWDNIQTVRESDGVYIYKFIKSGKPIWVAWNDNEDPQRVRITLDNDTKNVRITEAVPKYESGKEVKDYNAAFKEIKHNIMESYPLQVEFELGKSPVFMESVE